MPIVSVRFAEEIVADRPISLGQLRDHRARRVPQPAPDILEPLGNEVHTGRVALPRAPADSLSLSRLIAIFDQDGGGDVDFQEFVYGLSAFSSKGNKEQKLRFAFQVYDIDRDGFISNGELFIVLKMMVGSNLKDQQLQQIVDKTIMEADLDGDGKISFEEFSKVVETTDVSMSMTLGMCTMMSRGPAIVLLLMSYRPILISQESSRKMHTPFMTHHDDYYVFTVIHLAKQFKEKNSRCLKKKQLVPPLFLQIW